MKEDFIDCIVLSYQQKAYVLPVIAIAELLSLQDVDYEKNNDMPFIFLKWRHHLLPLISLTLTPFEKKLDNAKIVIINTLSTENEKILYVATQVEGVPRKIRIKPQDLSWQNLEKKIAVYTASQDKKEEFILLDLYQFSKDIEALSTQYHLYMSPNSP